MSRELEFRYSEAYTVAGATYRFARVGRNVARVLSALCFVGESWRCVRS